MKRISCIVALLLFLPMLAVAAERKCVDDTIEEVAGDGAILTMESGSIWRVDEVDRVDSGLWLSVEDVLICRQVLPLKNGQVATIYTIINKEENGEEVGATRVGHK